MSSEAVDGEVIGLSVARRLGVAPNERAECSEASNCPDLFELACGNFAIIGTDVSTQLPLPEDAGCGPAERIVMIPRAVLLNAMQDLSSGV